MGHAKVVKTAGGVIVRRTADGHTVVLLVYRAQRDDWTFPKGKRESGEGWRRCALREVEEETGLRCRIVDELPATRYVDRKGRRRVVRYWMMRALAGRAAPRGEIDAVQWVRVTEAARILTYARDRRVLVVFAARPRLSGRSR